MGAESQIPTYEPATNILEELGESFLATFWHSVLDPVSRETTSRDVDGHVGLLELEAMVRREFRKCGSIDLFPKVSCRADSFSFACPKQSRYALG